MTELILQFPGLTVLIPLIAAAAAPLAAYISPKLARGTTLLGFFLAIITSSGSLYYAIAYETIHYHLAGWAPPWGIEYVIDPLAAGMAVLITSIGFLVAIFAGPYLRGETWLRQGIFYTLYLLVAAGLLGMVSTGDVFNLYVFLEISALASYGLIALGGARAAVAAYKYLLIGTVAACFYFLGIGYLYIVTGTLNMMDMIERVQPYMDTPAVIAAVSLIAIGLAIKMAVFPLHGWLPDAYTYAPPPVTAFISAVMTKVSAYVLLRLSFFILGTEGAVAGALTVLGWLAAVGIIMGSVMAIAQQDFRRMLAYSSIAQIGYVLLGISLGNVFGLIGALLHILNHGIMKCCLFLIAGGVKWKTGEHTISKYVELHNKMPVTMGALMIAAFSMIGLPPTAGFFSKWYLVIGSLDANAWAFIVVLVVSSLMNLIYFFRVIENTFLRRREEEVPETAAAAETVGRKKLLELPATMLIPIAILGVAVIVLGIFNEQIVSQILVFSLPGGVQ